MIPYAHGWADALLKANADIAKQPDVPEWERRPFADSPREYWLQAYPGTQRARLERAIKEHAEGEKEQAE